MAITPTTEESYEIEFGSALYLEFRRELNTTQFLVIPETKHPDTNAPVPAMLMTRMTSEDHPRRSWAYKPTLPVSLPASTDPGNVVNYTKDVAKQLAAHFGAMVAADWEIFKTPLAVDLGPDDVRTISDRANMPDGLMRRMNRVRLEAGFPVGLYNDNPAPKY